MAEQAMLPKFAPVGRPISLAPKGSLQTLPTEFRSNKPEPKTADTRIETGGAAPALEFSGKKVAVVKELVSDVAARSQSTARICQNAVPVSPNWFRLRKNPFMHQSSGGTAPQITVQAELSLDSVRPVRNDLSDADLEVVAAGPEATPVNSQKPDRRRWFKPAVTGPAWSRLTARWFGSERVRA
jgi:hypothetical protein